MALPKFTTQKATLGQDPEIGSYPNGDMYARLNLASNKNWKDKNDEWQQKTVWLNCTVNYDNIVKKTMLLNKGDSVAVEGYIDQKTVEKDGTERTYTNYIITSLEKLAPKEED